MRVIELGAGMGHLARTMRLLGLSRSNVIIDIPETLVFSHCFLKKNFPGAKLLLVDDRTPASFTLSDYDFVFVPALFADRVLDDRFDLFVNTASMGEMKNEVIRYWMDFIQNRLSVVTPFTLNRYLNTTIPRNTYGG
jgi:putative sugar O-methyltransferase